MQRAFDKDGNSVYIDEAVREDTYFCPFCKSPLVQRRGEIKSAHFAHYPRKSDKRLDEGSCTEKWKYDSSDWRILWQRRFPKENREVILDADGERHIADVFINNTVIEFQNTAISYENFRERNEFYYKLHYDVIWLFNLQNEFKSEDVFKYKNDPSENKYGWKKLKAPFKDLDAKEEKAAVYLQLDENRICFLNSINGEKQVFYIKSKPAYTAKEFAENIINSEDLIPSFVRETLSIPNCEKQGGKSLKDLWQSDYKSMQVTSLFDKKTVLIQGDDGIPRKRGDGYLGNYWDWKKKAFNFDQDYSFRTNRPIWVLRKAKGRDPEDKA